MSANVDEKVGVSYNLRKKNDTQMKNNYIFVDAPAEPGNGGSKVCGYVCKKQVFRTFSYVDPCAV